MSLVRTVARNIVSNWVALAVTTLVGFFMTPFLISRLGSDIYGLWIFIGSFSGFFGLVDFGLRSSVSRYVAYYMGRDDMDGARDTLASSFHVLSIFSLCVCVVAGVVAILLPWIVPEQELTRQVQPALFLVGCSMAIGFMTSPYGATLVAAQRFDILRTVDILRTFLRVILVVTSVLLGGRLLALAAIQLALTATSYFAFSKLAHRHAPFTRIRGGSYSRTILRTLYGYGIWNFVIRNADHMLQVVVNALILNFLGSAMFITFLSLAHRLVRYAQEVSSEASGVLLPVLSQLDGREVTGGQRVVFMTATRLFSMICIPLTLSMILLGRPLIAVWVDEHHAAQAFPLLLITMLSYVPTALAMPATSLILGKARNRILGFLSVGCFAASVSTIILIHMLAELSLAHVALALAVPRAISHGIIVPLYAVRISGGRYRSYLLKAIFPGILAGAPQAACLVVYTRFFTVDSIGEVLIVGALGAAVYGMTGWFIVLDRNWRERVIHTVAGTVRLIKRSPHSGGADNE